MILLSVLSALLTLSYGKENGECPKELFHNIAPKLGGKLKGGAEVDIVNHPYHASLLRFETVYCAGTIVSKNIVLTAAHCVYPWQRMGINQYSIKVGINSSDETGQKLDIAYYEIHEKYRHEDSFEYDLALIYVSDPIVHPLARPIQLPFQKTIYEPGQHAVITGFGKSSNKKSTSVTLHALDVTVIESDVCGSMYRSMGQLITPNFWCGHEERVGDISCQGLSGGPAIIDGKLAGIVIFGAGCAESGYPGLYLNVPNFMDWIPVEDVLEEEFWREN